MFFGKKNSEKEKCENCGSLVEQKHSFCAYCGNALEDTMSEKEDFGMLGKNDFTESSPMNSPAGFGITDKLINSLMNSMMKNLEKQFKDAEKGFSNSNEIKSFPNGIKIKISGPFPNKEKKPAPQIKQKPVTEEQIKKISVLPREKAKSHVKRLGNKIVYELATPGVSSLEDIFVSKLESGYEIKAVGEKKVYVNSIPINLPMKSYTLAKNKISFEFLSQNHQ